MDSKLCPHCKRPLETQREGFINCCSLCRRYGLLRGSWPEQNGEKLMLELTDEQIARVFTLCEEIAAVKDSLPAAPKGFNVSLEIARSLRDSLAQHNAALAELADLLHTPS